jgi:hypothetical protein
MTADSTHSYKLQRDANIASFLDTQFVIPGTSVRFGMDAIIGLIPGIGDACAALISFYFLYRGWEENLPKRYLALMILNILIELTIGAIPILGDAFDVMFKANLRNYEILKQHMLLQKD